MANNSGNILIALIAGAAVGVGVGVLLAPDKGENTRKKIKEGFDSTKDDALEKLLDLFNTVKGKGEEVMESAEDTLHNLTPTDKKDQEELIALLEKKLAELKNEK